MSGCYAQIASFAKLRGTAAHRDVIGPKPTLVQFASNGSTQPEADMVRNDEVGKTGHTRYSARMAAMRDKATTGLCKTNVGYIEKGI